MLYIYVNMHTCIHICLFMCKSIYFVISDSDILLSTRKLSLTLSSTAKNFNTYLKLVMHWGRGHFFFSILSLSFLFCTHLPLSCQFLLSLRDTITRCYHKHSFPSTSQQSVDLFLNCLAGRQSLYKQDVFGYHHLFICLFDKR